MPLNNYDFVSSKITKSLKELMIEIPCRFSQQGGKTEKASGKNFGCLHAYIKLYLHVNHIKIAMTKYPIRITQRSHEIT